MAKKLFHHLVIENEVRNEAEKMIQEAKKGFLDRSKYEGQVKKYQPKEEGGEPMEDVRVELVTTVQDKLDYINKYIIKLLDFEAVKDCTNVKAKADLVIDGVTIGEGLPATLLLQLEKRLREVRAVYAVVPTLDLSVKWEPTGEKNRYKHGPVVTYRKEKKIIPIIMSPATKEHPALVKESSKDIVIGEFELTKFTGAVHPRLKAEWLGRIDRLIEACKVARMEANEADLVRSDVGSKLFGLIHAGDLAVDKELGVS